MDVFLRSLIRLRKKLKPPYRANYKKDSDTILDFINNYNIDMPHYQEHIIFDFEDGEEDGGEPAHITHKIINEIDTNVDDNAYIQSIINDLIKEIKNIDEKEDEDEDGYEIRYDRSLAGRLHNVLSLLALLKVRR